MTTLLNPRYLLALASITFVLNACAGDDSGGPDANRRAVVEQDRTPEWVLGEFSITGDLVVAEGTINAEVSNVGVVEHNVGIEGAPFSSTLNRNEEETFVLEDLAPGDYTLFCDIDGHRDAGMETTLTVLEVVDGEISVPEPSE